MIKTGNPQIKRIDIAFDIIGGTNKSCKQRKGLFCHKLREVR